MSLIPEPTLPDTFEPFLIALFKDFSEVLIVTRNQLTFELSVNLL